MKNLKSIGEYLYGGGWQSALAKALNINLRSVQRWVAGTHPIPESAWQEIIELTAAKQLVEVLPVLKGIAEKHGLPEIIELYVYPDGNVLSPHPRTWSFETDFQIKSSLAKMLSDSGISARVVKK